VFLPRTCPECQRRFEDAVLRCPEDGTDLATAPADELIGRTIGSYRIRRLLGEGGMGAVYLAEHPAIGSRVAIKFLHRQFAADKRIVERFYNEARAVNVIGHDNILKILDLDVTADGRPYIVMEYLHGRLLQDLVDPRRPLPLEVAGPILLQVCEALQAAHDRRIVHRDLKPGNVHLTVHRGRKNVVKLVDFGIARVDDGAGASAGKTRTGLVLGTPAYMSPEQARGRSERIDGRSDVYSLGCMMFQMATGSVPFPEAGFGEVVVGHLQLPPPRPRKLAKGIPEAYEAVILRCLEKRPEDRYQSMREVHGALAQVMDRLGISKELPAADAADLAAPPAAARPAPRHRWQEATRIPGGGWWLGGGVGALAIASGVAVLVLQQVDDSRRQARAAQLAAERIALQAKEAVRLAQEEKRRLEDERIQLSVVSDPVGAIVEAVWTGGAKAAVTPFDLQVPKNASVHFAFSKRDFLSWAIDVVADAPKVVRASLARARAGTARRAAKAEEKKARRASAEMKDDTIPVEF
jgi:tRNA A-37 threonylcarbamoyl transferase component Bud32